MEERESKKSEFFSALVDKEKNAFNSREEGFYNEIKKLDHGEINKELPNIHPHFSSNISEQLFLNNIADKLRKQKLENMIKKEKKITSKEKEFFDGILDKDEIPKSFLSEEHSDDIIYRVQSMDSQNLNHLILSQQQSLNEKNIENILGYPKDKNEKLSPVKTFEFNLDNLCVSNTVFRRNISFDSANFQRVESFKRVNQTNEDKILKHQAYMEIKTFGNLNKLLICLFCEKTIEDENTYLNDDEKIILKAIFQRKYKQEINSDLVGYRLVNELKEITKNTKAKRPEEKYKFVFKKFWKYLKKKFSQGHPKDSFNRKLVMEKLYNHYFLQTSQELNIPLDHFRLRDKNEIHKTINAKYVKLVKKSDRFMKDFQNYKDKILLKRYRKKIKAKFYHLFVKWDVKITEISERKNYLEEEVQNIKTNKKFRIPWNIIEVESAIAAVNKLFEKIK